MRSPTRPPVSRPTACARRWSATTPGTGPPSPLVIDLPRGSYVPTFTLPGPTPRPRPGGRLPRAGARGRAVRRHAVRRRTSEPLALALTESLDPRVGCVPGPAGDRASGQRARRRRPPGRTSGRAGARCAVCADRSCPNDRDPVARARPAVRRQTGEVLWSDVCDQERSAVTGFHDEDDLVRRIAGTVGDFRGVVLRDTTVRRAGTRLPAAHAAMLSYYRYLDSGTRQDTETAARDLRLAAGPRAGERRPAVDAGLARVRDSDPGVGAGPRRGPGRRSAQGAHGAHPSPRARARVDRARGRGVRTGAHRPVPGRRQPRDRAEPVPPVDPLRVRASSWRSAAPGRRAWSASASPTGSTRTTPGTSTSIWPSTGSWPAITQACSPRPASSPTPRTSGAP